MSTKPDANSKKIEREQKLAAALRANLKRRKAARQHNRKAAQKDIK